MQVLKLLTFLNGHFVYSERFTHFRLQSVAFIDCSASNLLASSVIDFKAINSS
jgi:hypothetical protein